MQNGCNEDDGAFGVPFSFANASEFSSEEGKEATADFAGWHLIAGGCELHDSQPRALPNGVVIDVAMEMGAVVIMGMIVENGIEEVVCGSVDVGRKVSSCIGGDRWGRGNRRWWGW